jgi:hypothetical protein
MSCHNRGASIRQPPPLLSAWRRVLTPLSRASYGGDMTTPDFAAAIAAGDLQAVRACPKAELHNHWFAKADREYLLEKTGRDIVPVATPLASMEEMHSWVKTNIGTIFDGPEGRRLGIEATFVGAVRDGVTRIEFGDDVWMLTQGLGSPQELVTSIAEVHARLAPQIEWIPQLGLSRHVPLTVLQGWMAPWLDLGFHKVLDLCGDELAQPIEVFQPLYRAAKRKGMRLKAHVGEWGSADDVQRAVEVLELDEVQHGIAAANSASVMRFLAHHRIRLNICPTSNLLLGRVKRLEDHPIRKLFDAGVKVTVNTDDAIVFGVGVSEEFLRLHQARLFTPAELDLLRRWGLEP